MHSAKEERRYLRDDYRRIAILAADLRYIPIERAVETRAARLGPRGMTAFDQLAQAKARPLFVEDAVRLAFGDAIAWRIGGGAAPGADAFAAAAIAAARQALDIVAADSKERSRALSLVQSAAKRFSASTLSRRLMTVPASAFLRLGRLPKGPDAIVRDRHRHLHAIALRLALDPFDAGRMATELANITPLSRADRLTPLTIHIFSLQTGQRRTFEREVASVVRLHARVA